MNKWFDGNWRADGCAELNKKYAYTYFTYNKQVFSLQAAAAFPMCTFINREEAYKKIDIRKIKDKKILEILTADMYLLNTHLAIYCRLHGSEKAVVFALKDLADNSVHSFFGIAEFREMLFSKAFGARDTGSDLILLDSFEEISFAFPPLGYVPTKFGATYISRVPKRQYRRGFCEDAVIENTDPIFNALKIKVLGIGSSALNLNLKGLIQNIMIPQYNDAKAALRALEDGKSYAQALNKNICITFLPNKKYLGILYKTLYVGKLDKKGNVYYVELLPEAAPFKEEVLSILGELYE